MRIVAVASALFVMAQDPAAVHGREVSAGETVTFEAYENRPLDRDVSRQSWFCGDRTADLRVTRIHGERYPQVAMFVERQPLRRQAEATFQSVLRTLPRVDFIRGLCFRSTFVVVAGALEESGQVREVRWTVPAPEDGHRR